MNFAMVMHVLLLKNSKGIFPIEGFRLEVYLCEFTRHCVITGSLDYYLWGHIKMLVYETKVHSREVLLDRIFAAAEHIFHHPDYPIPLDVCQKLHCSWWRTLWTITIK
jgi:hypothetical protein